MSSQRPAPTTKTTSTDSTHTPHTHNKGKSESQAPAPGQLSADMLGTILGLTASVAYTASNYALIKAGHPHDFNWAIWVSCMKAVPVTLVAWALVAFRASQGLPALPARRLVLPLVLTGCMVQFGGNVMIQWAFSHVGLALTVPLNFAALLLSGAIMARIFIGEMIGLRTLFAMTVLIISIVLLATGAETAAQSIIPDVSWSIVVGAVLAAVCAGCSYAASGVVIRRTVTGNISISATLICITTTGVVVLGILSLVQLGPARMAATSGEEFFWMLLAGLLNAIAFFSLSSAYKHSTLMRVNFLNATQIAMAALIGIFWFGEAHTISIWLGAILTFVGLLTMGQQRDRFSPRDDILTSE